MNTIILFVVIRLTSLAGFSKSLFAICSTWFFPSLKPALPPLKTSLPRKHRHRVRRSKHEHTPEHTPSPPILTHSPISTPATPLPPDPSVHPRPVNMRHATFTAALSQFSRPLNATQRRWLSSRSVSHHHLSFPRPSPSDSDTDNSLSDGSTSSPTSTPRSSFSSEDSYPSTDSDSSRPARPRRPSAILRARIPSAFRKRKDSVSSMTSYEQTDRDVDQPTPSVIINPITPIAPRSSTTTEHPPILRKSSVVFSCPWGFPTRTSTISPLTPEFNATVCPVQVSPISASVTVVPEEQVSAKLPTSKPKPKRIMRFVFGRRAAKGSQA